MLLVESRSRCKVKTLDIERQVEKASMFFAIFFRNRITRSRFQRGFIDMPEELLRQDSFLGFLVVTAGNCLSLAREAAAASQGDETP